MNDKKQITCCGDGVAWGVGAPARPCSANDLFLIGGGTQCGNCGAVRRDGETMDYVTALRRFGCHSGD